MENGMIGLVPYQYEGHNFNLLEMHGEMWFAAADAARELGYHNTNDLTRTLDADEKGTQIVRTLGGEQEISIISEPGLYRAIIQRRANKKHDPRLTAKIAKFQRWVFHDVLPSIRRTGSYETQAISVSDISAEVRKVVGGIVKSVVHSELAAMIGEILPAAVRAEIISPSLYRLDKYDDSVLSDGVCQKIRESEPRRKGRSACAPKEPLKKRAVLRKPNRWLISPRKGKSIILFGNCSKAPLGGGISRQPLPLFSR